MKCLNYFFTLSLIVLFTLNTTAQEATNKASIEVTGTAEQEIEPDEIYIKVILEEYYKQ